jgi:hypothetical protein
MNKLRQISKDIISYRNDEIGGSIGAVPFESDDHNGFIVMTWYKERGRTDTALFIDTNTEMGFYPLTKQIALEAIHLSHRRS